MTTFTCTFCITINNINHINNCNKGDILLLNTRMNTNFTDLDKIIKEYIIFITYDQSLFPFYWEFQQYINLIKSKKLTNILHNLHYNKTLRENFEEKYGKPLLYKNGLMIIII